MAILSDRTIISHIENGRLEFEPEVSASQIQPGSLDIRLGDSYSNEVTGEVYEDQDQLVFEPGTFYLGHTKETVTLPDDICAIISGRSSIARKGLIIHTTAGWIDAGFSGEITLEIMNFNNEPIILPKDKRVGQLVFFQMDTPAEKPYGSQESSKYQGQKGPTRSRLKDTVQE